MHARHLYAYIIIIQLFIGFLGERLSYGYSSLWGGGGGGFVITQNNNFVVKAMPYSILEPPKWTQVSIQTPVICVLIIFLKICMLYLLISR